MIKLKIVQKGWEGYTGDLGQEKFIDGIMVGFTNERSANALAAAAQMVRVDADGKEFAFGVTESMVKGVNLAIHEVTTTVPVSQEELDAERERELFRKGKPPVSEFHTVESLKAIADEKGIQGLRDAAKPWGVRERSIPKLLTAILEAQAEFKRRDSGTALVAGAEEAEEDDVVVELPLDNLVKPDLVIGPDGRVIPPVVEVKVAQAKTDDEIEAEELADTIREDAAKKAAAAIVAEKLLQDEANKPINPVEEVKS